MTSGCFNQPGCQQGFGVLSYQNATKQILVSRKCPAMFCLANPFSPPSTAGVDVAATAGAAVVAATSVVVVAWPMEGRCENDVFNPLWVQNVKLLVQDFEEPWHILTGPQGSLLRPSKWWFRIYWYLLRLYICIFGWQSRVISYWQEKDAIDAIGKRFIGGILYRFPLLQ